MGVRPGAAARSRLPDRGGAALAVIGCALLAAVAGCGAAASTRGQGPARSPAPTGQASQRTPAPSVTATLASPASGPNAAPGNCPLTPVAGPPHTLTYPQSVDGWQYSQGPNSTWETPSYGQGTCKALSTSVVYINAQEADAVSIETGHHANLWPTLSSFWGNYLAGFGTPVPVPAGPLGGQAACALISAQLGWTCAWLDSDTFGVFLASGSAATASQAGTEMLAFRAAVEHPG
jgi:hypothetical protein